MKKQKTIAISFGGMSQNQISEEWTPFLYSLKQNSRMSIIESARLFPEGGWFFGLPPKDFGIMFRMANNPQTSPLKKYKIVTFAEIKAENVDEVEKILKKERQIHKHDGNMLFRSFCKNSQIQEFKEAKTEDKQ